MGSGGGRRERLNDIQIDYTYSDGGGFDWEISTTDNDATRNWGVLNAVVFVRLCHPYCLVCTGDGYVGMCSQCNPLEQAKLSLNTCDKICRPGYGDDSVNP